jgi:hypothetical protein
MRHEPIYDCGETPSIARRMAVVIRGTKDGNTFRALSRAGFTGVEIANNYEEAERLAHPRPLLAELPAEDVAGLRESVERISTLYRAGTILAGMEIPSPGYGRR